MLEKILLIVLGAMLSFAAAAYWRRRTHFDEDRRSGDKRLAEVERRLTELSAQVSPFWSAIQAKIIADLTHPSPQFKEMDFLLAKLLRTTPFTPKNTHITLRERARLAELLEERIVSNDPEVTHDEKESAKLMCIVMQKKIAEDADSTDATILFSEATP